MDDDLLLLLVEELDRRAAEVARDSSPPSARRVAHALKGAFGMAGEREASDAFSRIERRLAVGDARAITDLGNLVTTLLALLRAGKPLPVSSWPEPPADLRPPSAGRAFPLDYVTAVHDRATRVDEVLAGERTVEAAREIYREIHTIKGSALAVEDELMAWFCHGLEERLKAVTTDGAALQALAVVDTFRGLISEVVDAPEHALETLRLMGGGPLRPSRPPLLTPLPLPPRRPALEIPRESDARGLSDEETVRVSTGVLDGLFERAGQLGQLRAPLSAGATTLARAGASAREAQRDVREALRMIGPPRPWGAPAAAIARLELCAERLLPLAESVEVTGGQITTLSRRLTREGETLAAAVHSLRTSLASVLFERVVASAQSEAGRVGKLVEIVASGGEVPIDRRVIENLVEPMRQLVRNAVVHGIEIPELRVEAGKPRSGTLQLTATQRAGVLTLVIEDDGAGVDVVEIRRLALSKGLITVAEAETLDDRSVLSLLFYPGFSLRADADLLAGRGVGLDLTLAAVQRLGGSIQLDSRPGLGFTATVALPAEAALVRVLWLECAGELFALPVQHTGAVWRVQDWARPVVSLAKLLRGAVDPARVSPARLVVEVRPLIDGPATVGIGVEAVGAIDEVALRGLPPIVRATGPFAAGIVWADDLRLSLDPLRIARAASRWISLVSQT